VRVASLVLVALLVAGCGGGPTTSGPTAARSLVLRPSDLPDGWAASPHDTAADNYAPIAARYARCVGQRAGLPADGEQASSPDFAQRNGARQVKSTVVRAGEDVARRVVRNLDRARSAGCLTDAFQAILPGRQVEGLQVRSVDTDPVDIEADADELIAFRTALGLRLGTTEFVVYVDNVFLATGPWFGRMYFVGTGQPLDGGLEHRLVATLAGRLADAR